MPTAREARPERVEGRMELPYVEEGGVKVIEASLNGVPCRFIFDSGASSVCLSLTEAKHLLKNHYLTDVDIIGKVQYQDASGDINTGMKVNIRELRLGEIVLHDVEATIINSDDASNLLGQSALERFGSVTIDYGARKIILVGN